MFGRIATRFIIGPFGTPLVRNAPVFAHKRKARRRAGLSEHDFRGECFRVTDPTPTADPEIVVTREMQIAGERALAFVAVEDYVLPESPIVGQVYRAMRVLEPH